jgi:phenylacetate-CoA ligase
MMVNAVRRTLWRTRLWLRGSSLRHLSRLHADEFLSGEQVATIQRTRLEQLLRWASREVPYWSRELEKSHIVSRSGTVRLDGFSDLPLLGKSLIREHPADVRAMTRLAGEYENTSGGSTGEPVRCIQHREYEDWGTAVTQVFDEWSGYRSGDEKVILWGSERDLLSGRVPLKVRVSRQLRNEKWLNAFRMDERALSSYVQEINRRRPVQILAYVDAAVELARYVERNGLALRAPRSVMTSAGTLYPPMRALIEQSFRAPVFDRYGCREVGNIASECPAHAGLHISPHTQYVEVLRSDGSPAKPGEVGRLIITQLINRAMPFIRFEIGDLGIMADGECPCGRHWPRLERVTGRNTSVLRTPDGAVDGIAVTALFHYKDQARTQACRSLAKYQIYQPCLDEVILRVVIADELLWREERPVIFGKLTQLLGPKVRLEVQEAADIPPTPSGKYVYIWSDVRN